MDPKRSAFQARVPPTASAPHPQCWVCLLPKSDDLSEHHPSAVARGTEHLSSPRCLVSAVHSGHRGSRVTADRPPSTFLLLSLSGNLWRPISSTAAPSVSSPVKKQSLSPFVLQSLIFTLKNPLRELYMFGFFKFLLFICLWNGPSQKEEIRMQMGLLRYMCVAFYSQILANC